MIILNTKWYNGFVTLDINTYWKGMGMENTTAMIIRFLGYLEMIAGFFVGVNAAKTIVIGEDFSFGIFIIYVIGSFIIGMLLIGFAEIIEILYKINIKLEREKAVDDLEPL